MKTRSMGTMGREGSALVAVMIVLGIAGFVIGGVLTAAQTYSMNCERNVHRDAAIFLADAGIQAAILKLDISDDGNISYSQSKDYLSMQDGFQGDWGFSTHITLQDGQYRVASVGKSGGQTQSVESGLVLGSGQRSIHALYAHALYAGNSDGVPYVLDIGGTGNGADFVVGDTYSGDDIIVSGSAKLRLPEDLNDVDGDGVHGVSETWLDSYAVTKFAGGLLQADFDVYKSAQAPHMDDVYGDGVYTPGEAYVDNIGNGVYDEGEIFVDSNGNGVWDSGDGYEDVNENGQYDEGIDTIIDNGNGVFDPGEEWTDSSSYWYYGKRKNNKYDEAGGFWKWSHKKGWKWKTKFKRRGHWRYCSSWPAESFEDLGDSNFQPSEEYVDQNGIHDVGEEYVDDRNGVYDYGTQAKGSIAGMPSPGPGQRAALGGDADMDPPDLSHMFYDQPKSGTEPAGALTRWGYDVKVETSDYNGNMALNDASKPEHIFVRNVHRSGNTYIWSDGAKVKKRTYSLVYDDFGDRVDDYFLEDPTDPMYTSYDQNNSIDGTCYTSPAYVDVHPEHNNMVYYVDGNVYLHASPTWCMRFRRPGTRITIVAKGNITVSDEFYYNADYDDDLEREDVDSTIVKNPSDALCLIALKNSNCSDSGNIYIGDPAYGTGGSIHALLYAENNFVDNNLNTGSQPFISVFGNMSAGNQVAIQRSGSSRTRLDVTLDSRIRHGEIIVPGLPHPVGIQRSIVIDSAWHRAPGSWSSWSLLK